MWKISGPPYLEIMKAFYAKHMQFYSNKNAPEDYIQSSSVMLNALNNLWDKKAGLNKIHFKYGVLKLPPKNYHTFRLADYGLNIFAPLKFHTLDLSNTSFFEFIQLRPLKFKNLL